MSPFLFTLLLAVVAIVVTSRASATALGAHSLLFDFGMKHFIHDPGTTNACLASPDGGTTPYYLDMKGVMKAVIGVAPTIVGGTGITLVRIFASSDIAGAVNATLVKTSGAIQLDNLDGSANGGGDIWRAEVHGQQLRELDPDGALGLRYLTVEITTSTNTDEAVVTFLTLGMFGFENQSATVQN
jgi:hypothetical protein